MQKLLPIFLCIVCGLGALGQPGLPALKPVEQYPLDVSPAVQRGIARRDVLLEKKVLSSREQNELDSLLLRHDETISSVWDVIGGECSWYCGGGNYAVKASSTLSSGRDTTYAAISANDLSYRTAWVEGAPGDGSGEYLEYHFKPESPRLTRIIISNGFVKDPVTWEKNNRVKVLRLWVNGTPIALLQLTDTRNDQVFEAGTLGRRPDGRDLVLRFEIVSVYKGSAYNDTVLTEIYFDGIDVH